MRIVCPSGLIVEARKMQGAEFETLAAETERKASGNGIAIFLRACWTATEDPGPYPFTGSPDWKRLLQGDVLAALVAHRVAVLGAPYDFATPCEACGTRNDVECMLDELQLKPLPKDSVDRMRAGRPFETTLLDGRKVVFDLGTIVHEELLEKQLKQMKRRPEWEGHKPTFIDALAIRIRSIDDVMNRDGTENVSSQFTKRLEFLRGCDLDFIYDLQEKMTAVDCGIDTAIAFDCISCGWTQKRDFPLGRDFFNPRKKKTPKTTSGETTNEETPSSET
jgi:hypothetical protein